MTTDSHSDGDATVPELDAERLARALTLVRNCMQDGLWRTLTEIRDLTGLQSTPGISARLRELRTERGGGHIVLTRRKGKKGDRSLYESRLILCTSEEAPAARAEEIAKEEANHARKAAKRSRMADPAPEEIRIGDQLHTEVAGSASPWWATAKSFTPEGILVLVRFEGSQLEAFMAPGAWYKAVANGGEWLRPVSRPGPETGRGPT